jgi:hypothetical protein
MTVDYKDLNGTIGVYELRMVLGVAYLDTTNQFNDMVIPYTCTGNPADTNVSLTQYWYSLDAGATWNVMTPTTDTALTGLTFSTSGTLNLFKWRIKYDLDGDVYNRSIKLAFQAYGAMGYSLETTKYVLFPRTVVDQAAVTSSIVVFPVDYSGVAGYELLVNAPKG